VVKSDHKAVVALPSGAFATVTKARHQRQCRPRTPSQNANLLQHLAATDMGQGVLYTSNWRQNSGHEPAPAVPKKAYRLRKSQLSTAAAAAAARLSETRSAT